MPAAPKVFKSERRVIRECWYMLNGSQEGTVWWDEKTAGNSGERQSPATRPILVHRQTKVKQVV
jgi:hypothetical protein